MKKFLTFFSLVLFTGTICVAQKVSLYSIGEFGKEDYEEFAFWVKANKRSEINYSYGKSNKEVKLKFIGIGVLNGNQCFKVQFSNNYILHIVPQGAQIKVSDLSGKYNKYFAWKYEGPVNGIGTFCEPCAEDEDQAMKLLKLYYLK
ncbi:MAG: hypothetical protein ABJB11_05660 [Ferruginibacter sp.]